MCQLKDLKKKTSCKTLKCSVEKSEGSTLQSTHISHCYSKIYCWVQFLRCLCKIHIPRNAMRYPIKTFMTPSTDRWHSPSWVQDSEVSDLFLHCCFRDNSLQSQFVKTCILTSAQYWFGTMLIQYWVTDIAPVQPKLTISSTDFSLRCLISMNWIFIEIFPMVYKYFFDTTLKSLIENFIPQCMTELFASRLKKFKKSAANIFSMRWLC